ncbi:unnamed protein product, partial [Oppiella nova]
MAVNPDVQQRLYDEINGAVDSDTGDIEYDRLARLPYLDAVMAETLRHHSLALPLSRYPTRDYKLGTTGITIKAGQQVEIPIYAIHHSEQYYPDPFKFKPDRFMPENKHLIKPYTYLPFGVGPRNCVALRFALLELKLTLVHTLLEYRMVRCPETDVPLRSVRDNHSSGCQNNLSAEAWLKENTRSINIVEAVNMPDEDSDQLRSQYVRSIPDAILADGLLLQGRVNPSRYLSKMATFEVRANDIWLVSYPKSGTTWTKQILSLIDRNGNAESVSDVPVIERIKHIEVYDNIERLASQSSDRMIGTHLPATHIPTELKQLKCKIIYVVRNPKDTAVSYYYYHRISKFLGNYNGSWDTFCELFVHGHLFYGDWLEHVYGYWKLHQLNPDNVLFVSYEE